jgi:hypothetical protein
MGTLSIRSDRDGGSRVVRMTTRRATTAFTRTEWSSLLGRAAEKGGPPFTRGRATPAFANPHQSQFDCASGPPRLSSILPPGAQGTGWWRPSDRPAFGLGEIRSGVVRSDDIEGAGEDAAAVCELDFHSHVGRGSVRGPVEQCLHPHRLVAFGVDGDRDLPGRTLGIVQPCRSDAAAP